MKKMAMIAVVVLSMFWLGGCMVIECDDYGPPEGVCVVPVPPPPPMIHVVPAPGPGPWSHHHHGPPHPWRW